MAGSRASVLSAACVAASLAAAPVYPASPQIQSDRPITLDARSSDFDYRNSTLLFKGVKIAQGDLSIEADEATATGLNFADSKWTFRGSVKITMPDGSLASDEARITFAKNEISDALITGKPATFQQQRENGVARGRARRIEYDFGAGTVRLSDGAWLTDGTNEIDGRTLVYSMKDQRVLAAAAEQQDQRVRITINPSKPGDARKPDAKPNP
jgi:lipopolysaccharide transport protein LptA